MLHQSKANILSSISIDGSYLLNIYLKILIKLMGKLVNSLNYHTFISCSPHVIGSLKVFE